MKFKAIPVFWLKTLAEGLADLIFYQEGVSNADEIFKLSKLSKYKLREDQYELIRQEIDFIKATDYIGNYIANNLYPKTVKYFIDNKNLTLSFEKYKLFLANRGFYLI